MIFHTYEFFAPAGLLPAPRRQSIAVQNQPDLFTDEPTPPDLSSDSSNKDIAPECDAPQCNGAPASGISPAIGRLLGVALAFAILMPVLLIAACSWKNFGIAGIGPRGARDADPFYDPARHIGEPTMRVRLARRVPVVTIDVRSAAAQHELTLTPAFAPHLASTIAAPIQISLGPTAWRIIDGLGATRTIPRLHAGSANATDDLLTIRAIDGALLFDGDSRPGDILLHAVAVAQGESAAATIDVVEHLPIELYLAGVVDRELYAGWHLETYKAQAIAARSYALHERKRRAELGTYVDVDNSTSNQVYGGHTANRTAIRAIEQTRGVVLTWQGDVLRAYYSSTVGGRAASAADTWPTSGASKYNAALPLQASLRTDVDDFSPLYRWTVERPRQSLSQRLRAWAEVHGSALRNIKFVKRIEVSKANTYHRPTVYRLYDDDDRWYELSAESLRVACNTSTPSLAFPSSKQRIKSSDFEVILKGDGLIFKGRGFGHGVGMSQYGAEGMARAGTTADDILMHYYPGALLERAY